MSPRTSIQIEEILHQLEIGRDGTTRIMAGSRPFHLPFNQTRDISQAIDELVETMTGDREKCHTKPQGWYCSRP